MDEWWRGAVIYQIYPASFFDSNNDGWGDLSGITRKLDHVASLGVDGIWITPFYPSPLRDLGYDVSNYRNVDPRFGTLADFDALLARAHALGLKVLIDQVWSHTAREHPWFQESRSSRDNPKADWYVWADAKADGTPPNNWQSWMFGPGWQWDAGRRQYYFHNFLAEMPDLNFHCPDVQTAILDVARFWLDRGVDGFRLDTALFYFHDAQLRDNPGKGGAPSDNPVLMQDPIYSCARPENLLFLERLRRVVDGYDGRMCVGEIGGGDESFVEMVDYTLGDKRLHTAYCFQLLAERRTASGVGDVNAAWMKGAAATAWPSWAFSNHDVDRVVSRWNCEAPVLMALLLALRGTIFLYQGEELGLAQSELAFEELRDPVGVQGWPKNKGRDGCRTPMPWVGDAPHGGFSAAKPWLRSDPNHAALAVDRQAGKPGSMLELTRALIALRRSCSALQTGGFHIEAARDDALLLRRTHQTGDVVFAVNLSTEAAEFEFKGSERQAIAVNHASLSGGKINLPPQSAIYLR